MVLELISLFHVDVEKYITTINCYIKTVEKKN